MRTLPVGWRNGLAGSAAALAAATSILTLLNVESHDGVFELSVWLGGGSVLLLLAIAFLARRRNRASFGCGLAATLLGFVGVAAYLLAYNGLSGTAAGFGLALISFVDLHMTGALLLMLTGAAVLMMSLDRGHGFGPEVMTAAGVLLCLLVPAMIAGRHFHIGPLEAEVLAKPLLASEGVLLLAIGAQLLAAGLAFVRSRFDARNRFLPLLAFVILLAASFHLWLVLVGEEQLSVRRQTLAAVDRLETTLRDQVRTHLQVLERLKSRMELTADFDSELWVTDAQNHLRDLDSLSAVGWITADGYVRWAVSRESREHLVGQRYAVDARRRDVLERARRDNAPAFSDPLQLRGGGFGQIVALPLARDGRFSGWLVVGLRFSELFANEVSTVMPGFAVRVLQDDEVIFERIKDERMHPLARPVDRAIVFFGLEWRAEVWPEGAFFGTHARWLPGVLLTLGVIAALLFAISLNQLEAQRRRTRSLRASEERYRLTAELTGEIIYDCDIQNGRIEWVGAIEEIMHITAEQMNRSVNLDGWMRRLHPEDAEDTLREFARAQATMDRFVCEYRLQRGDGSYVRVEERGVFLPGPDGQAARMLGTLSDVRQRHEYEQRLRQLAHFDQQTGLRNRVWFMEDAERATEMLRERGGDVWFVFMDLDRFKVINETLGHVIGDLLLEAAARRLESVVGSQGALARLGGDEFGVSIHSRGFDRAAITEFCETLMQAFAQPFNVAGQSLFVTMSVGIACCPRDGASAQQVIRAAETAMFRAKQRGQNIYVFYESAMSTGTRENLEIANGLRRALERDEFHLVFQPRYNLESGRITGMEALLRWESPERGAVSPAVFIPVAEETGLIGPIGWYVVDAAAATVTQLGSERMHGRRLAINVSARQLLDAEFVPELLRRVLAAGAKPEWLEIELTETLIMSDRRQSRELLVLLSDAGFTISIDDFGTGYSSLSYLKHFPADNLKIDRSFVMGLPESDDDAAIVRTIIRMGQGLGLHLIAEGIETEAQSRFLREAGCQDAQGFLFARPMPLDQLMDLLSKP